MFLKKNILKELHHNAASLQTLAHLVTASHTFFKHGPLLTMLSHSFILIGFVPHKHNSEFLDGVNVCFVKLRTRSSYNVEKQPFVFQLIFSV